MELVTFFTFPIKHTDKRTVQIAFVSFRQDITMPDGINVVISGCYAD